MRVNIYWYMCLVYMFLLIHWLQPERERERERERGGGGIVIVYLLLDQCSRNLYRHDSGFCQLLGIYTCFLYNVVFVFKWLALFVDSYNKLRSLYTYTSFIAKGYKHRNYVLFWMKCDCHYNYLIMAHDTSTSMNVNLYYKLKHIFFVLCNYTFILSSF